MTQPRPKSQRAIRISQRQIAKVAQLEKQVWKAAKQRNRADFAKLVPADALMIFRGGAMTQPEYLATIGDRSIEENPIEPILSFMPNRTTIILVYKTARTGCERGRALPAGPVIESTVWIRRGRRWVAILNQETPVSE
jgi:hypothetical protein